MWLKVLLETDLWFLEFCFGLSGMLFGENTLKSCLSSGSLLLSVFPLNQKGLFKEELMQLEFIDLSLAQAHWSCQDLPAGGRLPSRVLIAYSQGLKKVFFFFLFCL